MRRRPKHERSPSMKMAWKQLKASKLRSFLTMLGIIIGVASVILLVSLGNGVTQEVDDQMGDLGSNLITVVNSWVKSKRQIYV